MPLDISFWIALTLSILKTLEIVVPEAQQKRFQGALESITLSMSYFDFAVLFTFLRVRRIQLSLALLTVIMAQWITFLLQHRHFIPWLQGHTNKHWGFVAFNAFVVFTIFPIEVGWLARGSPASFFIKAGIVLASTTSFTLVASWLDWDIYLYSYPRLRLFILGPVIVPISVCLYGCCFVLLLKSAQACVWLLSKILWRIVEYPKGAWTAVLFLVTALIAVAQAFFHPKH